MAQAGAPRFRILLLGGFELHSAGRVVLDESWDRRNAKSLLKLLALRPAQSMHREALIDALWPRASTRSGLNSLNQTLYVIRRAVGDAEIVAVRGDAVALGADVWIDAVAFRAAAERLDPDDERGCDDALALYRGPLLPDDLFDDWTASAREELALLHRGLLHRAAEHAASRGDYYGAEQYLRTALVSDPADEETHVRLMQLLLEGGAPRGALKQYRVCTAALLEHLNVAPSSATAALGARIRDRVSSGADDPPATPLDVRYARSRDGTRIAYTTHGNLAAGVPLVHMPALPWSHLQVEWDIPAWRSWIMRLTRRRPLIRYDLRGLGLSEPDVPDLCTDRQVEDLEAVIDAIGIPQFDLLLFESTGPAVITYALRHPDRVRRIVFYRTWADGAAFTSDLERRGMRQMADGDWELYCDAMGRAVARDEDLAPYLVRWMQTATTREMFERYWEMCRATDVTPLLQHIQAPSLMLARPYLAPAASSADLALDLIAEIPGGRVVEIDGEAYHFIAGDIELVARAIDGFLEASDGDVRSFGVAPPVAAVAQG